MKASSENKKNIQTGKIEYRTKQEQQGSMKQTHKEKTKLIGKRGAVRMGVYIYMN